MEGHFIPSGFSKINNSSEDALVAFDSLQGTRLAVSFLDDGIAKVTHKRLGETKPQFSSICSNELNESSFAVGPSSRFSFPRPDVQMTDRGFSASTKELTLNVKLTSEGDIALSWSSQSTPFLRDLDFRAYPMARRSAAHYICRNPTDLYFGMTERSSPLLLNGRRFRLEGRDSLGYDVERTDPLYKSVPFTITVDARTGFAFGLYYHSYASGVMDLGCEIDALVGPFRYVQLDSTDLEFYLFAGPTIEGVVEKFAKLTGMPSLPPKYSLGYLASAMGYAEAENAQEQIARFPELCRQHDIPCDLLHLSSGYTVDPTTGARNVFTWNSGRFPNARKLFSDLRKEGIRVAANIKPWLLKMHPNYDELAQARGFVWNPVTDSPSITRLWSAGEGATATGSYFDFLSPGGRTFWDKGITDLLNAGIEGIWIDNNEYSIEDDLHTFNPASGAVTVGAAGRGIQTLHMALVSRAAMLRKDPSKRPFLLTRAASACMHGICAQSWSGDNLTSWNSLRGSVAIGLNAGLSLWSNYGHDIGGFVGPVPEPELLARWVQLCCLQPRFCIHSWKVKENVITEPWMHLEVLSIIRSAIHFRYLMVPYLYQLLHEAHATGHPFFRPLIYHYPTEPALQTEHSSFLVGRDLLHAPILDQTRTARNVFLPLERGGWFDFWTGRHFSQSGAISVDVPMEQHGALFARGGSLIPMLTKVPKYIGHPDGENGERRILCFPFPVGQEELCESLFTEDDGESLALDERFVIRVWMRNKGEKQLEVGAEIVKGAKTWKLPVKTIWFVLPQGDQRKLVTSGGDNETRSLADGRMEVAIKIE
jgi:alpha-glucosidase